MRYKRIPLREMVGIVTGVNGGDGDQNGGDLGSPKSLRSARNAEGSLHRLRTANGTLTVQTACAVSQTGIFPRWRAGFCASESSPAWIGSTFASAVLGNPRAILETRYNGSISSTCLPPWNHCIFLWNWGRRSPVLHDHEQMRAADVFPVR